MSISTPTKSGKLEARIAEIQGFDWSEEEKERAISIATLNYETVASITNDGKYNPRPHDIGPDYLPTPRVPHRDDINEVIRWQDATDHS